MQAISDVLPLCLSHVVRCWEHMELIAAFARVSTVFAAATRNSVHVELLKSAYKKGKDNYYDVCDEAGIRAFRVELDINGETLLLRYLDDAFSSPCGEVPQDSVFTLRLFHKLTQQEWVLKPVRGAQVVHQDVICAVSLSVHACIEYKIMPKSDRIEVKISGGSRFVKCTAMQSTADLFNFLLLMKRKEDGCNSFMTKHELTPLKADELKIFGTAIVDGVPQPRQRVPKRHRCGWGNFLSLAVSGIRGLSETTNVDVIFVLDVPDSNEPVPLTTMKILKHEKYCTWTIDTTITEIDRDKGIISCELQPVCAEYDWMDTHLFVHVLWAMRKESVFSRCAPVCART